MVGDLRTSYIHYGQRCARCSCRLSRYVFFYFFFLVILTNKRKEKEKEQQEQETSFAHQVTGLKQQQKMYV